MSVFLKNENFTFNTILQKRSDTGQEQHKLQNKAMGYCTKPMYAWDEE